MNNVKRLLNKYDIEFVYYAPQKYKKDNFALRLERIRFIINNDLYSIVYGKFSMGFEMNKYEMAKLKENDVTIMIEPDAYSIEELEEFLLDQFKKML